MKKIYLNRALVAKKKLFFLTALLCARMMSWAAAVYTGTPFSGDLSGYTYNIAYTVTYNDDYSLTFTAEFTGTFTKTDGLVFEVWSSDLSTGTLKSFTKVDGDTWSVTDNKDYSSMEGQHLTSLRLRIASSKGGTDQLFLSEYTVGLDNTTPIAPDDEKPVMTSATLSSVTWNKAVISVSATDNIGVTKYHVVNTTPAVDVELSPSAGTITVTGLTESTTYNFTITAKDAAGNESENSKIVEVTTDTNDSEPSTAAPTPPALEERWYRSLYSDTYTWALKHTFATSNWGSVPGEEKAISENHYLLYDMTKGTQVIWGNNSDDANSIVAKDEYAGAGTGVDASSMEYLHIDIWSNVAINNVKVLVNDDQLRAINITDAGWQSFDIVLENPVSANVNLANVRWFKIVDINNGQNLAFDNIYFWRTPVEGDETAPTNVNASYNESDLYSITITVNAEEDNDDIMYTVKLGNETVGSSAGKSGVDQNIVINNLEANSNYTFSVIAEDMSGNAADPVDVVCSTKAIPAPATTPTVLDENVKSIYSDAYTPITTVTNYELNWWQAPKKHDVKTSETDNALYYDRNNINNSATGWSLQDSINIEDCKKVHISIYPYKEGTLEFYPVVQPESEYHRTSTTLIPNQWNELVFDYSEKTFTAFNLLGFIYHAYGSFFIDNVYFFKEGSATAISNAEAEVKAVKMIENGQLVIIKNGVRYTLMGAELR